MDKRRLILFAVAAGILITILLVFLTARLTHNARPRLTLEKASSMELGVTYLPVTSELMNYYGLGVDYGVLITQVTPSSIAARAGLLTGDVILAYNDTRLSGGVTLLSLLENCPAGRPIRLDVYRDKKIMNIEALHTLN